MSKLIRFGVSLEKNLLDSFDTYLKEKGFPNRSEAIRALLKEVLVKKEWEEGEEVVGVITLVYDHHHLTLASRLKDISHRHYSLIVSTQHIHLDQESCLEVVIVRGKSAEVKKLGDALNSVRGLHHSSFTMTTTGGIG